MGHFNREDYLHSEEVQKKVKDTNLKRYGSEYPFQSKDIQDKCSNTINEKYGIKNITYRNVTNYDILVNDNKLKDYIIDRYNKKGSYLLLQEIASFFNIKSSSLSRIIKKLNLSQYFYIQESNLEVMFKDFLETNNIKYIPHYRKKLYTKETNRHKEIDFYIKKYNIGFEINDISTHNSLNSNSYGYKDKYYHRDKSLLAREDNINIIHIFEWELRNPNIWNRLSKWILNLLNTNKTIIDYKDCKVVELVSIEDEIRFLTKYSYINLDSYNKSYICIGIYHDNELIQIVSFNIIDNDSSRLILKVYTKYGYSITNNSIDNVIRIIRDRYTNIKEILYYLDISKYDSNTIDLYNSWKKIDVVEPKLIWCNKDMDIILDEDNSIDDISKYIPIYDCGEEVYLYNF